MKAAAAPSSLAVPDQGKIAPSLRAAYKGGEACQAIIASILAGVNMKSEDRLYIVDVNPMVSADWSTAVWQMMKKKMAHGCDWPHMAYHGCCNDSDAFAALSCSLERMLVDEWWLPRPESGPSEPVQDFDESKPNLSLASWNQSCTAAILPGIVRDKFERTSHYHDPWQLLVQQFETCSAEHSLVDAVGSVAGAAAAGNSSAAAGRITLDGPDYSVEPKLRTVVDLQLLMISAEEWNPDQVC